MNNMAMLMQAVKNPQQFIQQMMGNSQAMQNPMIRNAIEMYQKMVLSLVDYYGLKEFYNHYKNNCYDVNAFDIEKSGHGRVLKREYNLKTIEAQ